MAASVLGSQVAVSMVTLEAIGLLLEVLGEVPSDMVALLQDPLTAKLTCPHSLLRAQASAAKAVFSLVCSQWQ